MNIDNYGVGEWCWQLDHIIPISSAKTQQQVIRLCHYTNYQPLWQIDNYQKKSKSPHQWKVYYQEKLNNITYRLGENI